MSYYFFIPFATFLFHFFLFTYVFAMDRNNRVNRAFLLFTFVMGLWVLGCTIYYIPIPPESIVRSMKLLSLVWSFTGISFLYFLYAYLNIKKDILFFLTLAAGIASAVLTNMTDLVIQSYITFSWGQWLVEGPLYQAVIAGSFTFPVIYGSGLLFYHQRKVKELYLYRQYTLIIFGIILNLTTGLILEFFIPALDPSGTIIRLTSLSTIILTGTFFYIIVRYKFLTPDIRDTAGAIFAGVQDAILILSPRGRILHANESAKKLLCHDQKFDADCHLNQLIPGYTHIAEYHNQEFEIHKNGETLIILMTQSQINYTETRRGIILIIRDVTEQRKISRKLKQSEEQYRSLVENISEIIFEVSPASIVTYTSPAITTITGHRVEDLIGKSFFQFIHPDDSEKVRQLFSISPKSTAMHLEFRGLCADGTFLHFMSSGTTAIEHDGGFGYRGVLTNIENLVQTRQKLKKTERLYNSIVHNISDVIWIMRIRDLTLTYVSPSVINLHGRSPEDYLDTPLQNHTTPESFSNAMSIMSEELNHDHERDPDRSRTINFTVVNKKGTVYHNESTTSFLRNSAGEAIAVIAVTRDITERIKLQAELEKSLKTLQDRNTIIESDMKTAQMIQQALLPERSPENSYMISSYRYLPVEVVGGDYFNFIELREGGVGVFIADVVGHGVPAALFLSLLKSSTNKIWRKHALNPKSFMETLNEDLYDVMSSYFITGLYGFLKQKSDGSVAFTFSSGGHPPPVIYRAAHDTYETIHLKGPLVGAFREKKFHETTIELNKKDRLFIYTDGLPETVNSEHQIIGFDHLTDFFKKSHGTALDDTLDNVVSNVEQFRDESMVQDDMVLIGIEII